MPVPRVKYTIDEVCDRCRNLIDNNLFLMRIVKYSLVEESAGNHLREDVLTNCTKQFCSDCWEKLFGILSVKAESVAYFGDK